VGRTEEGWWQRRRPESKRKNDQLLHEFNKLEYNNTIALAQ